MKHCPNCSYPLDIPINKLVATLNKMQTQNVLIGYDPTILLYVARNEDTGYVAYGTGRESALQALAETTIRMEANEITS